MFSKFSNQFRFILLTLLIMSVAQTASAGAGFWSSTGSLSSPRMSHTATLLANGQVLVVGGDGFAGDLASAELYNPASGLWSSTGALAESRGKHTATLLTNGKVLVAGGYGGPAGYIASAELYDPTIGLWSYTGTLNHARYYHTATRIADGQVLVTGGADGGGFLNSTELYNPVSGLWTNTAPLLTARMWHTATLLTNGKVLVVGGRNGGAILASAELYDPTTGQWSLTGTLHEARASHTATLLSNGNVLVVGGEGNAGELASAELYDPNTGLWSITGLLSEDRSSHTATLLPDGTVLVAGGIGLGSTSYVASAELYNPVNGLWTSAGALIQARYHHTATLLDNGQVLVTGGYSSSAGFMASAELYVTPQILDQTITITANAPASAQAGDVFTVSATATSGLPLSYSASGACTNVGATFTMISGAGNCTVYYDQSGNSNYNPAPQVSQTVLDANDPPTALNLSSTSVVGNMPIGTDIGILSTTDADAGETFTYSLVSGTGSNDNSSFRISGNHLQTAAVFDATIKNSYAIRVRTTDSGPGTPSFDQTFTITVTANNYIPLLVTPANGDFLLNNRITFDWADVPGATSYRIQVNLSSTFANATKIINTTTTSSSYATLSDLPSSKSLFWRVQAISAAGPGPWSEVVNFITALPPSIPDLVAPKNNAKNISLFPTLDWTDSSIPSRTTFLRYELQISTSSAFASPMIVYRGPSITDSFYIFFTTLNPNTKYYWRVRAFNTWGQYSSWSTVFNFTTLK